MIYFSFLGNRINVFIAIRIDDPVCGKKIQLESFRIFSEIVTYARQFPA